METASIIADEISLEYAKAVALLEKQGRIYNPDSKDPHNQTKMIHTEFFGKDEWPDNIIFEKDGKIFFATRQTFKGKKSGLFCAHREDGPSICSPVSLAWCKNGVFHRDAGPASMFCKDIRSWAHHPTNWSIHVEYCQNGKWHREDGPAMMTYDGLHYKYLWIVNHLVTARQIHPDF